MRISKDLITVKQLSDRWEVDYRTVRRWVDTRPEMVPKPVVLRERMGPNGKRDIRFKLSDVELFEQSILEGNKPIATKKKKGKN